MSEPIKRPLTMEQFRKLTPDQIEELRKEGEVEIQSGVPGVTILAPKAILELEQDPENKK